MIDGRPVGVFSHDQTVFQGTVGEMFGRKVARLMEWCAMVGCPIIGIQDSGGARIQDAVTSLAWYAELGRRHELLSGIVPQISLIFGKCAGGAVYSPIQDDLLVAVRDQGYFFVTGPDVIQEVTGEEVSLDELGGADAQARYGNIHQVVDSEAAAFQYVRDFLSFLPSNCFDKPPIVNPGLEPEITPTDLELDSIVPDSDNMAYDMHEILLRIFDDGDFLDVAAQGGPAIITGFARVDGRPVGVIANQPMHLSGSIDNEASDKATRFIRFCDMFEIPLGVRRRHTRVLAGGRAGEERHHQARRPVPVRRGGSRRAEGDDHDPQVLRRRVRGDGVSAADRRLQLRLAHRAHRGDRRRGCRAAADEAVPRPDHARGAGDQERLHRGLQPQHGDPVDRRRARVHRRGHRPARNPAAAAQVATSVAGQAAVVAGGPQALRCFRSSYTRADAKSPISSRNWAILRLLALHPQRAVDEFVETLQRLVGVGVDAAQRPAIGEIPLRVQPGDE